MPDPSTGDPPWERRSYWQDDALIRIEWWQGTQPLPAALDVPSSQMRRRDYCYRHGTQIYPDLGCQVCRQLPAEGRRRRHESLRPRG